MCLRKDDLRLPRTEGQRLQVWQRLRVRPSLRLQRLVWLQLELLGFEAVKAAVTAGGPNAVFFGSASVCEPNARSAAAI